MTEAHWWGRSVDCRLEWSPYSSFIAPPKEDRFCFLTVIMNYNCLYLILSTIKAGSFLFSVQQFNVFTSLVYYIATSLMGYRQHEVNFAYNSDWMILYTRCHCWTIDHARLKKELIERQRVRMRMREKWTTIFITVKNITGTRNSGMDPQYYQFYQRKFRLNYN